MNSQLLRPLARQTCLRTPLLASRFALPKPSSARTLFSNAFKTDRPAAAQKPSWIATQLRPFARKQSTYVGLPQQSRSYTNQEWWTRVLSTAGVVAAGTVGIKCVAREHFK
jgi:hypothetical protein